jgi:hypothetical protein
MKSANSLKTIIGTVAGLSLVVGIHQALAQFSAGNWLRTDAKGVGMTMTAEPCCNGGRRLTYHIVNSKQPTVTMVVNSPMDGTEVPVLVDGKPSGETMAIKRVDERHYTGIVKMNGQLFATSSATVSADGKTVTAVSITTPTAGAKGEKVIETWIKQ